MPANSPLLLLAGCALQVVSQQSWSVATKVDDGRTAVTLNDGGRVPGGDGGLRGVATRYALTLAHVLLPNRSIPREKPALGWNSRHGRIVDCDGLQQAARHLGLVCFWLFAAFTVLSECRYTLSGHAGFDSHAYWLAGRKAVYGLAPGQPDAFLYSPAFAQVIHPLALLPWHVFEAIWASAEFAAFYWLLRPLGLPLGLPLLGLTTIEIRLGNVNAFLALALVLSIRRPSAAAISVLLKITTGVSVVWFALRGQWRAVALASCATLGIAVISAALAPDLWVSWIQFLVHHNTSHSQWRVALLARLPVACILIIVAAKTGRCWLLAFATMLAAPMFGLANLTILAALPRLNRI